MRSSWTLFGVAAMAAMSACAGRYHTGATISGTAIVQPRSGDVTAATAAEDGHPWAVGAGVELPAGRYEVAAQFDLPRPQRVEWTLSCPTGAASGTLGDTLDGPGRVIGTAQLVTTARGACALTATTDDANVIGTFQVRRLVGAFAPKVDTIRAVEVAAHEPAAPQELAPSTAPLERPFVRRPRIDRLQRRLDIALRTRSQLQYYFQTLGAVARPPMPEALAETEGAAPYEGAVWMPGAWQWKGGAWQWTAGSWGDVDHFSPSETEVADNADDWGEDYWVSLDDHITNPPYAVGPDGKEQRVRDHRTAHGNPSGWRSASHVDAIVRDHREWKSPSHPDATIRDHRDDDRGNNDSKSSDKDTKDYGGTRFGRPGR